MTAKNNDTLVEDFKKVADGFSDDFEEFLLERCDQAALNWLRVYGIPETPNDVWRIFHVVYKGVPALLVQEKKMVPTEGVWRDSEEREKRTAERKEEEARWEQASASLQRLFDPDALDRHLSNTDDGVGGYL